MRAPALAAAIPSAPPWPSPQPRYRARKPSTAPVRNAYQVTAFDAEPRLPDTPVSSQLRWVRRQLAGEAVTLTERQVTLGACRWRAVNVGGTPAPTDWYDAG